MKSFGGGGECGVCFGRPPGLCGFFAVFGVLLVLLVLWSGIIRGYSYRWCVGLIDGTFYYNRGAFRLGVVGLVDWLSPCWLSPRPRCPVLSGLVSGYVHCYVHYVDPNFRCI